MWPTSAYGSAPYLAKTPGQDNLVNIARLRGNRTLYQAPAKPEGEESVKGHPIWYGQPFSLRKETTCNCGRPAG